MIALCSFWNPQRSLSIQTYSSKTKPEHTIEKYLGNSELKSSPTPSKVLVIGSGPIVIGQAAEFDYAGTQACKALREEGVTTVLVNSNPATIMTDEDIADIVYIEPLTVEVLERIIAQERPDGVLPRSEVRPV